MIRSIRDADTARIFEGKRSTRLPAEIQRTALRKLLMLDAAARLDDLRIPPGNHLEALGGDRRGQFSIRINEQWRICFHWSKGDADGVEIVDYHR